MPTYDGRYDETGLAQISWSKTLTRNNKAPLDRTSLWGSYAQALKYAKGDGTDDRGLGKSSYPGQILSVFDNNKVDVYVIAPSGDTTTLIPIAEGSGGGGGPIDPEQLREWFLSKDQPDVMPYDLTLCGTTTFGAFNEAPMGQIQGAQIDSSGNAIFASVKANSFEIYELIYNRLKATDGQQAFTLACGKPYGVENEYGNHYTMCFEKSEGMFDNGDVIYAIKSKIGPSGAPAAGGTCWMHVTNVSDNGDGTYCVSADLYGNADVPDGHNIEPEEGMMFAHWGNLTNTERQSTFYIDCEKKNYIQLDHVWRPIIDNENYAVVIGILPESLQNVLSASGLPISPIDSYVYAKNVITENSYEIDPVGNPIKKERFRGEWNPEFANTGSTNPYTVTETTYDTVTNEGSYWACNVPVGHVALQEPSYDTYGLTDWICVVSKGEPGADGTVTVKIYDSVPYEDDLSGVTHQQDGDSYIVEYEGTRAQGGTTPFNHLFVYIFAQEFTPPYPALAPWHWKDVGKFTGTDGKNAYVHIGYSNYNPPIADDQISTITDGTYKYVSTYADSETGWTLAGFNAAGWTLFKGEDGESQEFIFTVTTASTNPGKPFGSKTLAQVTDDVETYIGQGHSEQKYYYESDFIPTPGLLSFMGLPVIEWTDNATSIDANHKYCWICTRKKRAGEWGLYETPALFGSYGEDGAPGTSVSSMTEVYGISSKCYELTEPEEIAKGYPSDLTWQTDIPASSTTQPYLWNAIQIKLSDNSAPTYVDIDCLGEGIKTVQECYSVNNSGTKQAVLDMIDEERGSAMTRYEYVTSHWSSGMSDEVMDENNPYLWNIEALTFWQEDKDPDITEPALIGHFGQRGADGSLLTAMTEVYAISQWCDLDDVLPESAKQQSKRQGYPTDITGWTENIPEYNQAKPYLWNAIRIDMESGTPIMFDFECLGKGIKSVTEYYIANNYETMATPTVGDLTGASSNWKDEMSEARMSQQAPYLWNCELLEYFQKDDTGGTRYDVTAPSIIGHWGKDSESMPQWSLSLEVNALSLPVAPNGTIYEDYNDVYFDAHLYYGSALTTGYSVNYSAYTSAGTSISGWTSTSDASGNIRIELHDITTAWTKVTFSGITGNEVVDVKSIVVSSVKDGNGIDKIIEIYGRSARSYPPDSSWTQDEKDQGYPVDIIWKWDEDYYENCDLALDDTTETQAETTTSSEGPEPSPEPGANCNYCNPANWNGMVPNYCDEKPYLWNALGVKFADGSREKYDIECLGEGVVDFVEKYTANTYSTSADPNFNHDITDVLQWNDSMEGLMSSAAPYLWNAEILYYIDERESGVTNPSLVGHWGENGTDGTDGEDGVNAYNLSLDINSIVIPVDPDTGDVVGGPYEYTAHASLYEGAVPVESLIKYQVFYSGGSISPSWTSYAYDHEQQITIPHENQLYKGIYAIILSAYTGSASTSPGDVVDVKRINITYVQRGQVGPMGETGVIPYPAGYFDKYAVYINDGLSAPYVLYNGHYYLRNQNDGPHKDQYGIQLDPQTDIANNGKDACWTMIKDDFEMIYTKMLFANFAQLGKAVFYGKYMFSEEGVNSQGNIVSYSTVMGTGSGSSQGNLYMSNAWLQLNGENEEHNYISSNEYTSPIQIDNFKQNQDGSYTTYYNGNEIHTKVFKFKFSAETISDATAQNSMTVDFTYNYNTGMAYSGASGTGSASLRYDNGSSVLYASTGDGKYYRYAICSWSGDTCAYTGNTYLASENDETNIIVSIFKWSGSTPSRISSNGYVFYDKSGWFEGVNTGRTYVENWNTTWLNGWRPYVPSTNIKSVLYSTAITGNDKIEKASWASAATDGYVDGIVMSSGKIVDIPSGSVIMFSTSQNPRTVLPLEVNYNRNTGRVIITNDMRSNGFLDRWDDNTYQSSMFDYDGNGENPELNGTFVPNLFLDFTEGSIKANRITETAAKIESIASGDPITYVLGESTPNNLVIQSQLDNNDSISYKCVFLEDGWGGNGERVTITYGASGVYKIESGETYYQINSSGPWWGYYNSGMTNQYDKYNMYKVPNVGNSYKTMDFSTIANPDLTNGNIFIVVCADGRMLDKDYCDTINPKNIDIDGYFIMNGKMSKFVILSPGELLQVRSYEVSMYDESASSDKYTKHKYWFIENAGSFDVVENVAFEVNDETMFISRKFDYGKADTIFGLSGVCIGYNDTQVTGYGLSNVVRCDFFGNPNLGKLKNLEKSSSIPFKQVDDHNKAFYPNIKMIIRDTSDSTSNETRFGVVSYGEYISDEIQKPIITVYSETPNYTAPDNDGKTLFTWFNEFGIPVMDGQIVKVFYDGTLGTYDMGTYEFVGDSYYQTGQASGITGQVYKNCILRYTDEGSGGDRYYLVFNEGWVNV